MDIKYNDFTDHAKALLDASNDSVLFANIYPKVKQKIDRKEQVRMYIYLLNGLRYMPIEIIGKDITFSEENTYKIMKQLIGLKTKNINKFRIFQTLLLTHSIAKETKTKLLTYSLVFEKEEAFTNLLIREGASVSEAIDAYVNYFSKARKKEKESKKGPEPNI